MEIRLISDAKMKMTLSSEDMDTYGLDGAAVSCDSAKARKAFWGLLDEAKRRTGFDTESDKILIQMYPSGAEGCELFVTRLGQIPPMAEKTITGSGRVAMLSMRRTVYGFPTLTALTDACLYLTETEASAGGEAWYMDGAYYLLIEERIGKSDTVTEFTSLLEYGYMLPADAAPYFREHGECIIRQNAVPLLSALSLTGSGGKDKRRERRRRRGTTVQKEC